MPGQYAGAVLLIIAGVWVLLQSIVGGLPGRLLSFAKGN